MGFRVWGLGVGGAKRLQVKIIQAYVYRIHIGIKDYKYKEYI